MIRVTDILSATAHRPFAIPVGKWKYYQEWNDVLFLHWEMPYDVLRKCVPKPLIIDVIDGNCYVSLVAFTMQKIRPKNLPAIRLISDFHEINIRTYIDNDNKKGVYFLNIEAEKSISVLIAKGLSGLPYEKANINRTNGKYNSTNAVKNFHLDAEFEIKEKLKHKTALDRWLTERYCLYLDDNGEIFRYDIHHKEWEIKDVAIKRLNLNYTIGDFSLATHPPGLAHYSDGVKVLSWQKQKVGV